MDKPQQEEGASFTVSVELVSWVNTFVEGSGSGTVIFQQQAASGDTVRDVLMGLSRQHIKLHQSLWDPNDITQIGSHIEIIVNDAILGVAHQLDSPVKAGDVIILAGQYIGG